MKEILFKRLFLFAFLVCSVFLFSGSIFSETHPLYSGFSSAGSGFDFNNVSGEVSVVDAAVYRIGYFSVNGSTWQSFTLAGTSYNGDAAWLRGSSSYVLPAFGVGEHYIIVYSCAYAGGWDCHNGMWQLIVVNNTQVAGSNCSDNCSSLGYQCGVQTICGSSVNCGDCLTGYDCVNGVCVVSQNLTCNGSVCDSGEYCSNGVCLLNVSGRTYFVATNGEDSGPGTFERPWGTWQKAFDTANAGDIVYFRGGVWYPTVYATHDPSSGHGHNGTEANPVLFYNYPGEKPILDCTYFTSTRDASGLDIREDTYIKFRGLTVRNVKEKVYDHWIAAIQTYNTGVLSLEMMSSHDNGGHGFNFNTYDSLYVTNCDSYNNADIMSSEPGNRADGFSGGSGGSDTDLYKAAYYEGCRAWNNSDDGFDIGSSKQVRISNSWSFNNGYLQYGGGVGFKFGPSNIRDPNKRIIFNTLAVNNNYDGYSYQNLNDELVGPVGAFYNNFAYKSSMGFTSDQGGFDCANGYTQSIYRNNAVYKSTYSSAYDQTYLSLCAYEGPYDASRFIQENNSWIHKIDWPFWEYNPDVTITDADFISLDYSQLTLPRKANGDLPDVTFGHLVQGSDLIDAGVAISGFHCATAGAHPGEGCVEWYGGAPDLGPFESNY